MVTERTTRTSAAPAPRPERRTHLKTGTVGVAGIVLFVLSAQAPLTGIAGALPLSVGIGDGAGAPGAYLVVGAVIALFAVGFITMSRHISEPGAFYAYVRHGIGRPAGVGAAFLALTSYSVVQAAMYGLYGVTVAGLLQTYLSVPAPWWLSALLTMAVVHVLGSLNIELGTRFLAVLVAAEFALLIAFGVVTLLRGGGPEGLDAAASFSPSAVLQGAPGIAITFAIASMFGFESTAIYSVEAKDPLRTVPRATYLSVAVIALFFAFTSWMFISHYGASRALPEAGAALASGDSSSFVFTAVTAELGAWASHALGVLLATSLLAGILAFHNGCNRYMHSLAHQGSLPHRLATTNRHGAPQVASAVQTLTAVVLVAPFALGGLDPVLTLFSWFSGLAVLALLLLYVLTCIAVIAFFRHRRGQAPAWNTLVAPGLALVLVAGLTLLVVVNFTTLIGGTGTTAAAVMAPVPLVFVAGLVVAALTGNRRTPTPTPTPTTTTTGDPS